MVNTGDDIELYGLHVSPDLDSVTYWLGGVMDRERGWGRDARDVPRDRGAARVRRGRRLVRPGRPRPGDPPVPDRSCWRAGETLAEATAAVAARFGVARHAPADDATTRWRPGSTWWTTADASSTSTSRSTGCGEAAPATSRRSGSRASDDARPAPGVLEAIAVGRRGHPVPVEPGRVDRADPRGAGHPRRGRGAARPRRRASRPSSAARRSRGMADRLMPAAGVEVSAAGAADCYRGLLAGWVIDEADRGLAPRIEGAGVRVAVTDTIMTDDASAEALARAALELALS